MSFFSSIPFFPLSIFKMPGSIVPLHIFEERYRVLVKDLLKEKQPYFGIPSTLLKAGSRQIGILARLKKIERKYADGRYDISIEVVGIIEVLSYQQQLPGKLYAGGDAQKIDIQQIAIESKALIFKFNELKTRYPGIFEHHLIQEELTNLDLLKALPVSDLEYLQYALLPVDIRFYENFLRYQLDRIEVLLMQENAIKKGFCLN